MIFFYRLSLFLYQFIIKIAAPFNEKAKKFVVGRKNWKKNLQKKFNNDENKWIWIHAASLGEFEQGRPVIEAIKKENKKVKILLTFFSPSGYEIRKNYPHADFICYLPLDTPSNASFFIDTVKPQLALFIKYEFWYFYLITLKKAQIPVLMISCVFRENQLFFHPLGTFYHKALQSIHHYFVQDEKSSALIKSIGIQSVTLAGDTRFDRVTAIASHPLTFPLVEAFTKNAKTMVLGSVWPSCMNRLLPFIKKYEKELKFIIAPHNIHEKELLTLEQTLSNTLRLSRADNDNIPNKNILIIDSIGKLSSLYRYGQFAYIGGGFRGALHNTIEAACYGMPVCFGSHPNNVKFIEAIELIDAGGGFSFSTFEELDIRFRRILKNEISYKKMASISKDFVLKRTGASVAICTKINELLGKE